MPATSTGAHFRVLFAVLALTTILLLCYLANVFPDVLLGDNVLSRENVMNHRTAEYKYKANAKDLPWLYIKNIGDDSGEYQELNVNSRDADGKGFVKTTEEVTRNGKQVHEDFNRINTEKQGKMSSPYIDKKLNLNTTGEFKNKTILWWNPPDWLKEWFADFNMDQCEYKNCRVSFSHRHFQQSDAVVYSLVDKGMGYKPPVSPSLRNPDQAWIFFTLESPVHVKMNRREFMNPNWQNAFNWSWTYRTDADIFHPYGTLVTKEIIPKRNYSEIFRKKTKMAAWAVSHCRTYSKREKYENLLNKYAQVDIYGGCGLQPPANLKEFINNDYKFYLGFENSFCNEYMTEKFFHYYKMDLITIVRGKGDYNRYLPKGSFINTADFPSIKALATFMNKLSSNEDEYIKYLKVKDRYKVLERDFMYRDAACSVCEKLNNLEKNRKTYANVSDWLGLCYAINDIKE